MMAETYRGDFEDKLLFMTVESFPPPKEFGAVNFEWYIIFRGR